MGLGMIQMHGAEGIGAPAKVRKTDFAKLAKVSPGRVSQMVKDGLPVEPDGRIDVIRGKAWIKDNVSASRSAAQAAQRDLPFAAQPDAASERLRLLTAQADAAELKAASLRRDLVPAVEVEREWSGLLRLVRSGVLAVPSRLRQVLPHLTASDMNAIDAELRCILKELADAQ